MYDDPEVWIEIVTGASGRACAELSLVLETQGVEHQRIRRPTGWSISVRAHDAARASEELAEYRDENVRPHGARPPPETVGNGWSGVAVYLVVLLAVAVFVRQFTFGIDWLAAGRVEAGSMVGGEWWRAVTALTIHRDADHLLGNIAFGSFFAYWVCRYLGDGLGGLAIVASGALGNIVNALIQSPDHRAIGASTAVFAALALLSANTWKRGFWKNTPLKTRIAPLVAGLALLAFTGAGGENTDIGAHLFGFVAGFCVGVVLARYPVPRSRSTQRNAGLAACALVVLAWAWGIAAYL